MTMYTQCMSVPIQRRYYSSPLSIPHLFSLTLTVLGVIVPLLLAEGSWDFWPKTNSYTEQPKVKLTYDVITVLEGERTLASGQKQYLRMLPSSLPTRTQQLLQESMRASQIKSYEADDNRDGLPDALHVEVSVPLEVGEAIYQARAFVFLDFTVQNHAKFNMDALAVFSHTSPIAGRSLSADGDLVLNMRSPVYVTRSMETPFAASPLLNLTQIQSTRDLDLSTLITRYRSRSCYTHFEVPYPVWTNDISPTALRADHTRTFDLHLTIRVPPVDVLYRPTWSELLKTAWIQYYCIFVVIHAITWRIFRYLFTNRVLDTYSVLDDQQILTKKHKS